MKFGEKMNRKTKSIGLLSLAIIILIILVKTNLIAVFDSAIYNLLTANMNDGLTNIFKSITFFGDEAFIIPAIVLSVIIGVILKKIRSGAIVAIFVMVNDFIKALFKLIIQRPRPEILQLVQEGGFSFPSGHTMAAASLSGILIYLILKSGMDKNLKIVLTSILALMALLVGLSRIYLGVHYASDVLGAFIISSILLLILISINEKKGFF